MEPEAALLPETPHLGPVPTRWDFQFLDNAIGCEVVHTVYTDVPLESTMRRPYPPLNVAPHMLDDVAVAVICRLSMDPGVQTTCLGHRSKADWLVSKGPILLTTGIPDKMWIRV